MRRRIEIPVLCIMTLAAVATAIARGDEPKPQPAASKAAPGAAAPGGARRVITVRNGSAKDLAAVLQKFFQNEAEIQAVPDTANGTLLVVAPQAILDEVVATVAQIDRPARKLAVDVVLVDVRTPREASAGQPAGDREIDEREFSGPVDKVLARVENLSRQKKITGVRQMRVEALENQTGQFQVGEEKPRVNGFVMAGAAGVVRPTVQQRSVGSIVTVVPRFAGDGKVLLELVFRNDQIETPEDPFEFGKGPEGPVVASEVATLNLQTRVTVPLGQAGVAGQVQAGSGATRIRKYIIIAARIAEESAQAAALPADAK